MVCSIAYEGYDLKWVCESETFLLSLTNATNAAYLDSRGSSCLNQTLTYFVVICIVQSSASAPVLQPGERKMSLEIPGKK